MPLPESAKNRHEVPGSAKVHPSDLVTEFYDTQAQIRRLLERQRELFAQIQASEYNLRVAFAAAGGAVETGEEEEIFKPRKVSE